VRWIGPPDADEPASRVTLGPSKEEGATAQAAQQAAQTTAEANEDGEGESDWLARALAIAGLVAGLVALAATFLRRPRRA
jgi:hypothetical protein